MAITNNFSVGVTGSNYTPNTYSSLNDMIGKIAHTLILGVEGKNPLSVFDKMPVENGDTIEQAVVKLIDADAYDSTGAGALTRESIASMAVRYFQDWQRHKYKKTIDMSTIRKAMTSSVNAQEVADKIVSEMSQSRIHDKYESLKALLEWGITNSGLVNLGSVSADGNSNVDSKGVLKALKKAIKSFTFVKTSNNVAGIKQRSNEDDIYVVMDYNLKAYMDVEELASVFNLDKDRIDAHIIEIDATSGNEGHVFVLDQKAILSYTRLYEMVNQLNADGLFWNYFLHIEDLYALSPLFNAGYISVAGSM